MSAKLLLLYFLILLGFTSQAQDLTDSIYHTVDRLAAQPRPDLLDQIVAQETFFSANATAQAEHLAVLILQCNMAYYNRRFGRQQQAIALYEKAWQNHTQNKLSGYDITEFCLKPLGNLYTMAGKYTQAENTIKTYILLAEKERNDQQKIAGILNLSVVYHNTGNFQTAIELLKNALQNPDLQAKLKSKLKNNLAANLFAVKKHRKAKALLQSTLKNNPQASSKTYRNLAQIAKQKKDFQKAGEYLRLAEQVLLQQNFTAREMAKLYLEKAALAQSQQNMLLVQNHLRQALAYLLPHIKPNKLPERKMLYAENTFIAIFDALAGSQTHWKKALDYYDLSFYVAGLLGNRITSQKARIIHQIDNRIRSEKCIELLYKAYKNTNDTHFLALAFRYAERSKASVLKAALARKSLVERFPAHPILQKRQHLAQQQEAVINRLVRAQLTHADQNEIRELIEALNAIYLKRQEVGLQIRQKYNSVGSPEATIPQLQEKLRKDNASMVLYFFGKNNLYTFLLSENSASLEKRPVNEGLQKSVQKFISFFEDPMAINKNISAFTKNGFRLYKNLQLNLVPTTQNMVIIPDGLLAFVPFEALLTKKAQTNSFVAMPFLIKQHRIVYNTSAGFYLRSKISPQKNKLLGVFPVFKNSGRFLRYSVEEAESIKKMVNASILMGQNATKLNFLKKAESYSILHLSTHASGGSLVVPAAIEFYDGVMLVHELYALNLSPSLVVLSACETGIGKLLKGEGAMSIARGFQYAGADNLLFSLWQVNDRATAQIMGAFYESYSDHASFFIANHQSKLAYLKNPDLVNAQKSPYYWSGFVYYGAIKPKAEDTWSLYLLLLSIPVFLFLFFFAYKKWKT